MTFENLEECKGIKDKKYPEIKIREFRFTSE